MIGLSLEELATITGGAFHSHVADNASVDELGAWSNRRAKELTDRAQREAEQANARITALADSVIRGMRETQGHRRTTAESSKGI